MIRPVFLSLGLNPGSLIPKLLLPLAPWKTRAAQMINAKKPIRTGCSFQKFSNPRKKERWGSHVKEKQGQGKVFSGKESFEPDFSLTGKS